MRRVSARETALSVLAACRQNGAWVDGALKAALKKDALDARDAALASRIAYGVMQNRLWLDYRLSKNLKQRPEKLDPLLLDILRIGAYQVLKMDKIPPSAAINEAVNMAKHHRFAWAGGLVNAVLRNALRQKDEPDRFSDAMDELSVRTSHPKALCERMVSLLGREEAAQFLSLNNESVPMSVQTNPLKTTAQELKAVLEGEGVEVSEHAFLEGCFELSSTGNLENLRAFQDGLFTVQDAAAKLAAMAACPKAGERVIDTCAAPGGKSIAMAMAMGNEGSILSCDVEEHKLALIEKNAERLGISIIQTRFADARVKDNNLTESADLVFCDVPCSGLGIIRKKPDIRYKDLSELAALPQIQRDILETASSYVKRGGTLIYSTCTVLPEENEAVTDDFLARHHDFTYETFTLPAPLGTVEGHITLWPQRHGMDGFYICRMKRS